VDAPARKAAWLCPLLDALQRMVVYPWFAPGVVEDCPPRVVAWENHLVQTLALMMGPKVVQEVDRKVVQPALKAELEPEQAHSSEAQLVQASLR
jgi:hypothetical protein